MEIDYRSFVVLLARQRSGTNALTAVLRTHPEIRCHREVFNNNDPSKLKGIDAEAQYFNFLRGYAGDDIAKSFPDRHESLAQDYFAHLRSLSDERYLFIDIKYNSTHHFTRPWQLIGQEPFLYEFIRNHDIKVLHITRRNYLRYLISTEKAVSTGVYGVYDKAGPGSDFAVRISPKGVIEWLRDLRYESELTAERFAGYPHCISFDYTEMFREAGEPLAGGVLESIAAWLELKQPFESPVPAFKKQSSLPLRQALVNYGEIEAALRGTEFEYCLEDEPLYQARA